jgi:hypothetical protein
MGKYYTPTQNLTFIGPSGDRRACGSVFSRDLDVERVEFAVVVVVVVAMMMIGAGVQTCRRCLLA